MHRFWNNIIRPCFDKAEIRKIVEVGCDLGVNTSNLIRYCKETGGFLNIVDPSPKIDADTVYSEYQDYYQFYRSLSLNVLWRLTDCDAILIDGDHNWYTVYNELKMIRKSAKRFPIIMFHDVSWPYDRRDMYYDPSNIPNQYVNAYEHKGINIDTNELSGRNGFNAHFNNSVYYNNLQCGVLTAIEDFISESKSDFKFTMLPIFNGLGILFDKKNQYPEDFVAFVESLDCSLPIKNVMVEADKNFSKMEVRYFNQKNSMEELKESCNKVWSDNENFKAMVEQQKQQILKIEANLKESTDQLRSESMEICNLQQSLENKQEELLAISETLCTARKQLEEERDRQAEINETVNAVREELELATRAKEKIQKEYEHAKDLEKKYKDEANKHYNSIRYRIGTVMINATHSIRNFVKLPVLLSSLYREGKSNSSQRVQSQKKAAILPITAKEAIKKKSKFQREDIISINRQKIGKNGEIYGTPLVSIIIINHNGVQNLERLFVSFEQCQFYNNYELIIVDNNSSDRSIDFLQDHVFANRTRIIRNHENLSFSRANNQAVEVSRGEFLLFLNNDIEATDGWLDEMVIAAQTQAQPGAIGAKLVYPVIPENSVNRGKSFFLQHRGIAFSNDTFEGQPFIRPYNKGEYEDAFTNEEEQIIEQSAVTAAVMLVPKQVFEEVGGFDQSYQYGYEDVDLCLKIVRKGYKIYYCPTALLFHFEFGTQNYAAKADIVLRRTNNIKQFKACWQEFLNNKLLEDKINNTCLYSEHPLTVAFVVTEAKEDATAGDYFTALELAESLKKLGYRIKYLPRRGPQDWYDVGLDVDVLISMLDSYHLSKMINYNPALITIAWVRNWFDRWCEQSALESYSLVLASSQQGCTFIERHAGIHAELFPIATNHERFLRVMDAPENEVESRHYHSDYVFTGSYWNDPREIIEFLHPEAITYCFKIFGKNWESVPHLRDYSGGFVPYQQVPLIYKHTKLVIDDANSATKQFGAVNSRVFDALASGRLVITNGKIGAQETFQGMLPCFSSRQELESLINLYLGDEALREKKIAQLREFVLENHTYEIRAKQLVGLLKKNFLLNPKKIAIMVPVPKWSEAESWGDYHFAVAMKKVFLKNGYTTEIRILPEWQNRFDGKYVIVLRGLSKYITKMEHVNIMWNISHPDQVHVEEYNQYDAVFVASLKWAEYLRPQVKTHMEALLQCTDPEVFYPEKEVKPKHQLLFVGNSRKVLRKIIRDLLPTPYQLAVFGTNWNGIINDTYIKGENIPNRQLGKEYQACEILLNDHWDDMREKGFISNRIFDGLAAGAFIISDEIDDIEKILDGCLVTYHDQEDLRSKIEYYMTHPDERAKIAKKGYSAVTHEHTFNVRLETLLQIIRKAVI